jgi:hypothetical protein
MINARILVGSNYTLTATYYSGDYLSYWSSSDSSTVSVDSSTGKFTANKLGAALVIVHTAYGNSAACLVTVVDNVNFTYAQYGSIMASASLEGFYDGYLTSSSDNYLAVHSKSTTQIKHRMVGSKNYYDYNDKSYYFGTLKLYMDTLVSVSSLNFSLSGGVTKENCFSRSNMQILNTITGQSQTDGLNYDSSNNLVNQNYGYSDIGAVNAIYITSEAQVSGGLHVNETITAYDNINITLNASYVVGNGNHYVQLPNQVVTVFETPYFDVYTN